MRHCPTPHLAVNDATCTDASFGATLRSTEQVVFRVGNGLSLQDTVCFCVPDRLAAQNSLIRESKTPGRRDNYSLGPIKLRRLGFILIHSMVSQLMCSKQLICAGRNLGRSDFTSIRDIKYEILKSCNACWYFVRAVCSSGGAACCN